MTRRPHKRPAPRQSAPLTGTAPAPAAEAAPVSELDATLAALSGDDGGTQDGPTEQPGVDTGGDTGESSTDASAIPSPPPAAEPAPADVPEFTAAVEAPPREKTLNELNIEARAIDREHAARREEAERLAIQASGHLIEGTMRGRARYRRAQKPVRPPVTE